MQNDLELDLPLVFDYAITREADQAKIAAIVPPTCNLCARYMGRKNIVMGAGNYAPVVMYVGPQPEESDELFGRPYLAERGILLDRILQKSELSRRDVYITYLVKCYGGKKVAKPKAKEAKICFQYLNKEIRSIAPKLVILEGPDVLKHFMGDRKANLTLLQGGLIKLEQYPGILFMPIYNIDSVYSDSNHETQIVRNIKRGVKAAVHGVAPKIPTDYIFLETEEKLDTFMEMTKGYEYLSLDIETDGGKDFMSTKTVCWAVCWAPGKAAYFPWLADGNVPHWSEDRRKPLIAKWNKYLENKKLILHNGKYDLKILRYDLGITSGIYYLDTLISSNIIDETQMSKKLKNLAWVYTSMGGYDDALEKIKQQLKITTNYSLIPREILKIYVCGDVDCTFRIYETQMPMLKAGNLEFLLYSLYMPVNNIFMELEYNGVYADREHLAKLKVDYEAKIADLTAKIHVLVGKVFEISSDEQLTEVLFTDLKLPVIRMTKTQESTDKDTLEKLRNKHAVIPLLLEYRATSTLLNTFVIPLLRLSEKDNRIHTDYKVGTQNTSRTCVARGTLISAPRNLITQPQGVPVENVRAGDYIYCYDDTLSLRLKRVIWAGKTGHKQVIRVHWCSDYPSRSGYVDLTPEHKVRQLDGSYVPASTLQVGQSVLSLSSARRQRYNKLYAKDAEYFEHRFVYKEVTNTLPEIVHHVDKNPWNNYPDNLTGMTNANHCRMHSNETWSTPGMREAASNLMRERCASGEMGKYVRKGTDNSKWIPVTRHQVLRELARNAGRVKLCKYITKDFSCMINKCKAVGVDPNNVRIRYGADNKFISKGRIASAIGMKHNAALKYLHIGHARWGTIKAGFVSYIRPRNHKVTQIEILPTTVDVFDIEVQDCHNFIAGEICVHNSSAKPNLQNLPRKNKDIKKAFTARPGYIYYEFDFSQIEIRVLAHLSQDQKLLADLNSGLDIHRVMASTVYNIPPDTVTKDQRSASKSVSFGIIYGMSWKTLAEEKGMSKNDAKKLYDNFFRGYPGVAQWIENVKAFAREFKCVYTPFGRIRHLDGIDHPINSIAASCARCAVNSPIQSMGADIPNLSLINMLQTYPQDVNDYTFCFQIHDAVVLEMSEKNHLELFPKIKQLLETTEPLCVPTPVGIKRGPNLGNMEEIA